MDDFGVEYVGKKYDHHLSNVLKEHHKISKDWEGKIFQLSTYNGVMQRNTMTELVACL